MKNTTPYIGKLKLKFEKYPNYTGRSKLNKVHLDLGFTKLVSRIFPNETKNGWEVDPEKVKLINRSTGGVIKDHWVENREPKDEFTLPNSFLSEGGNYIGSIEEGWWYYNNNLKVCDDYPHGVALKYEGDTLIGYYGYTHRGGQLFKIGDKIFDEHWAPEFEDIKDSWVEYYEQIENDEVTSINEEFLKNLVNFIPFNERGSKIIENWGDCLQSSINLSKYLS